MQIASRRQCFGARAGDADSAKAVDLFDEPAVDLGHHEVIVDDEHVTHARPAGRTASGGSRTTNIAPPAGASLTSTVPPCCAVTSRTNANPMPRRRHIRLRRHASGEDLLPEVFGHTGTGVGHRNRQALSIVDLHGDLRGLGAHRHVDRIVDQVAEQRDHIRRHRRGQGGQMRSGASSSVTPLSAASEVLAISRAATAGSEIRLVTASLISARRRVSVPTRSVPSRTHRAGPGPEMVCSWLANSWVCARSVSVTLLCDDSWPCSAASSVLSRIVVTVPIT